MNKNKRTSLVNNYMTMTYLQKKRELERQRKTQFFFTLRKKMDLALIKKPTVYTINYKNSKLLGTFFNSEGKILSREITKITAKEQRQITRAIKRSRMSLLVPYNNPSLITIGGNRRYFQRKKKKKK